ncbi:Uncharacterised protein [Yersinia mollaretii]|uniref:hypothetical protein n=1 Tax=Yersinia mollaretii TaxID=33060 RepID=UPI0005E81490|nr:hypothetical protein [Yersinia mollaretii]CNK69408.1 Uncharacterised protein [Yersinia mollaretii]
MADASFTFPKGVFQNYSVFFESLPASIKLISDDEHIDTVEFTIKKGIKRSDFFDQLEILRLDICIKGDFCTDASGNGISWDFQK